ncbi:substance-K receptor-like [Clytia hemisphaerica]|uniref:substance-K receptor-like n=1 Tax=Clytia hemisphaerica TaxID=252671 RepID=UPI0034D6E852
MMSNDNKTIEISQQDGSLSEAALIIFTFASLFIIFIGVILNATVICLYRYKKIIPTLFNFYLAVLGVSNIIQDLGAIHFIFLYHRETEDLVPVQRTDLLCNFIDGQPVFWIGGFVTVYTICFMNIKWYTIITKPLRNENKKRRLVYSIIGFWLFGIILLVPNMYTFEYDKNVRHCMPTDKILGKKLVLVYKVSLFGFGYVIPMAIMLLTYLMIIREFYFKSKRIGDVNKVRVKYRKKMITFLTIIMVVFFICWSPFGIAYIIVAMTPNNMEYVDRDISIDQNKRLFRLTLIPCYCAATLNVVCFAIKDKEISRCFKDLMKLKFPARVRVGPCSIRTGTRCTSNRICSTRKEILQEASFKT